ncbi:MAG: hypothetical protein A3K19_00610 [Lentisphaerae bacterium RIFOXYB12_FULL_65_16]|nr:MAG: hypothetical protein A3K18_14900 [Lentisphaerae bacterium RIFOXYA12_64_32]OGV86791.1 MAG: hypothetical protein A3K19_00610 [Lentisphaerae bacterium RIFOXYB12_FULL_65_16]
MILTMLAVSLVLILLNGFFVCVEFALVKARRSRLEALQAEGHANARLALDMQDKTDGYLSAAQLGITVASLAVGWIGEPAFAELLKPLVDQRGLWSDAVTHAMAFGFAFALITFLHILIGEQVPKLIAVRQAERSLLALARTMHGFYLAFYLPLTLLNNAANRLLRMCGFPAHSDVDEALSEEELRLELLRAHRHGEVSLDTVLLFENVFDFCELTTASIMVPMPEVAVLDLKKPWSENLELIRTRRLSRYPLCDGDRQRILGLVHVKDLGMAALTGNNDINMAQFRRDIPKVPETMRVETLLRYLQKQPTNMALVTDAAGMPRGVVTFEDVLEELVGEMTDEFEREKPWRLGDFLVKEAVLTKMKARTHESAVRELAFALASHTRGLQPSMLADRAMRREREAPTAVGRGVALPHVRVEGLPRTLVAYGNCAEGIDFKAADGHPVRHIFLILTPKENPREQLRALSRIAALATSDVLLGKLNEATTVDAVLAVVRTGDFSESLA